MDKERVIDKKIAKKRKIIKKKNKKRYDNYKKKGGSKYNLPKKKALNSILIMCNLWSNVNYYLKDKTIKKYFEILGINANDFKNLRNKTNTGKYLFDMASLKLVDSFFKHPTILNEIYKYIMSKTSKLEFLTMFSEEQVKYITNLDISDTKLIACAGSGKTRSIIGRIKFMVEHELVKKEDVYAITFSKHAATDFRCKIKSLFPNFNDFCKLKNFSTIDSLAKSILCRVKSHKSENVEILSIALRNYLREMPASDAELIKKVKNIKHLFIDEAQDLNEVQFDAAMLLKKKFGTQIHLIGDPNQNIFQFRRSSSGYLIDFSAKQYELTLNFRSTQEIIEFSEGLKPIKTSLSISATGKKGKKVTIFTKPSNKIHELLLYFIKLWGKQKVQLRKLFRFI